MPGTPSRTRVEPVEVETVPPVSARVLPLAVIGANLRARRSTQGRSLREVAQSTGLSPSFLSLVETGRSDISIGRLARLAEYYEIQLQDLTGYGGAPPPGHEVVRVADRRVLATPDGVETEFLARSLGGGITRILMTFQPGSTVDLDDYPIASPAESFFLVVQGTLLVEFFGRESVMLRSGDSIALLDTDFRRSRNVSGGITVVFVERVGGPGRRS